MTGRSADRPAPNHPLEPVEGAQRRAPGRGSVLALVGTVALVLAAFGVILWLTSDPSRRNAVEGLIRSPIGLLVLFGLAALSTATLLLPAPALAITAIAGAAGEPLAVGIVVGLGQAVGELTGFAAGWSGRSFLPDTPATRRVSGWLQRRGVIVIFLLALVPNPLFDMAGIAAGVARMPVFRYLGAAAAGKIIKNIIVAGGASTIGDLLAGVAGRG
jgi:uncharacterized membrane protein YdjX (TVP38/TMEM64 family)